MMTTRLYLAAAWSRQAEIRAVAEDLNQLPGIEVAARWLYEEPIPPTLHDSELDEFRQNRAQEDVEDVRAAHMLVRFTDDLNRPIVPSGLATGSRMFEMGLAYAWKKVIIVVGGTQPIFDYLPEIFHVHDVATLKRVLKNFQW